MNISCVQVYLLERLAARDLATAKLLLHAVVSGVCRRALLCPASSVPGFCTQR